MEFANLIPFWKAFLSGLLVTVELSVIAIVGGLLIGILTSSVLTVKNNTPVMRVLKAIVKVYVAMFRGAPLLILLFFGYYGIAYLGVDMPIFVACSYVLCLYGGAYICEIIRSGIESIPKGQMEAGLCIGLTYFKVMTKIILPQALKIAMPTLVGFFLNIIKDTSIVSMVGGMDLIKQAKNVMTRTQLPLQVYFITALIYFIICFPLSNYVKKLERRKSL